MSDSVTSAPVCDSRSSFCGWIWTGKAPTSQHLALRNMTNIEHRMFQLFQLLQNLRARDTEGLGKRRPDASRLHAPSHLRSCENRVLSSNNTTARTRGVSTARPTAPCSTPARDTLSWFISAWGVSSCNSSKPSCKLQKMDCPGHDHRITMHGHLTCPERFWHVSDTRIGTISNPGKTSLLQIHCQCHCQCQIQLLCSISSEMRESCTFGFGFAIF